MGSQSLPLQETVGLRDYTHAIYGLDVLTVFSQSSGIGLETAC
jgi:hypothetical protein